MNFELTEDQQMMRDMVKVGETPFESAAYFGIGALPGTVRRERQEAREVVPIRDLFDQKIHQRRGRFADGKTWMPPALQQHDRQPQTPRNHC